MEPSSNYSLNLHDRDIYTVYSQITHPPSLSAMYAALLFSVVTTSLRCGSSYSSIRYYTFSRYGSRS